MVCRVTEGITQSANRVIQAVFKISKRTPRPEGAVHFLARHDLARTLQQHSKDLERLLLQRNALPVFSQLSSEQIGFEGSETYRASHGGGGHGSTAWLAYKG